ncbi:MAG TPA: UDP-3-O-(3-hydroxymyristoyl)glucosamine N-acyltransferase, partial [Sedimentisphaerales bacterium]|nr:UDP-3-O-(3-hydroxymyristoyl)glucosamine N-acyltransferase [Sedimentisphaerales bacterium]
RRRADAVRRANGMDRTTVKTLQELATLTGGRVVGDGSILIRAASTLGRAGKDDIAFLANTKYEKQLATTAAAAVIVGKEMTSHTALLVAKDPYYAFSQVVIALHGHRMHKKVGVSSRANISATAKLGKDCDIHDFATVSDGATVGDRCVIYPGVFIGENAVIGDDCIIYANACIYDGSVIGNRVIINANSAIGEDGFGFATHGGEHHKIPQIGIAIIEDDVEIGTGCGIERGTLSDTVIGKGTKIGDMVAIGHGTVVGPHCLLVAQVGIAGSTTLGHHCTLGGQAGVVGHIVIGNHVTIGAQSGVTNNISDGQTIVGSPAIDIGTARRAYNLIKYLPEMKQAIRRLEKDMEEMRTVRNRDTGD